MSTFSKAVMMSFSKLNFIFACFIDSFANKRGILLGTMSTCILVLVVPMVMGIVATLAAVTCAPSPNLYWLSLFDVFFITKTFLEDTEPRFPAHCFICSTIKNGCNFWIHREARGFLMDGRNQFGIRLFCSNRCCSDFGCRDSSEPSGL